MIDRIKAFLTALAEPSTPRPGGVDGLQLAATALLIEAARSDALFNDDERRTIRELVQRQFGLSAEATRELIAAAEAEAERATQLFGFTKVIAERFSEAERIRLIEMLWEVIYADGQIDAFESNLMRRIAGLIYVPDPESGRARQRVLARLAATKGTPGGAEPA
jgi:uncharacterized tellurite resistance protein B-like protein